MGMTFHTRLRVVTTRYYTVEPLSRHPLLSLYSQLAKKRGTLANGDLMKSVVQFFDPGRDSFLLRTKGDANPRRWYNYHRHRGAFAE
jgi:hypothetical protein